MSLKEFLHKALLPAGVKDILVEDYEKIGYIEGVVEGVFERWGYKRIKTSLLEYEDILSKGIDKDIKQGLLKFIDNKSGRVVAVRSDITPQIARIVATRLKGWPKPLRLYYNESVLKGFKQPVQRHEEVLQIGAEMIGAELPEADAEVIAMSIEALCSLGLKGFKINIGHAGFLKKALNGLQVEETEKKAFFDALMIKDRTGLEELLSGLSVGDESKKLLASLPTLYGGREVIDIGLSLVKGDEAGAALKNLDLVLKFLTVHGFEEFITVDLGEARGYNYYTGVVFEGFVKGIGKGIIHGGRYDDLISQYGYGCPSVGFAFDLEVVKAALEAEDLLDGVDQTDYLIFNASEDKEDALRIARSLRENGFCVARDIIRRDYESSLEYCKKNRIGFLLSMGTGSLKEDEVMIENVRTGKRVKRTKDDVIKNDGVV